MHSLHTLLPSHGQRYKRICQGTSVRRNVPALQAARWATRLGPRVFTVQTGFLQALHCCTGEGEKGRRGEGEKHPCGKVQCRYTANFQPHPCAAGSSFRCVGNAGTPVEKRCPTRVYSPPGKLVQKRWWMVARLQPPPPTIAADCGPLRPSADCCLTAFLEAA